MKGMIYHTPWIPGIDFRSSYNTTTYYSPQRKRVKKNKTKRAKQTSKQYILGAAVLDDDDDQTEMDGSNAPLLLFRLGHYHSVLFSAVE